MIVVCEVGAHGGVQLLPMEAFGLKPLQPYACISCDSA